MTKTPAVLLAAALLAATASAADAPKPDPAKGAATFSTVCAACHGPDAGGIAAIPTQPKLAGQFPEYIAKQIADFKSGARDNPIMKPMAATLTTDADVLNVAAWISEQKPNPGTAHDVASLALGEKIYRGGIMDRRIPPCASCHSPDGAGIPAQFPRLAGQWPEYVTAQLTGFRDRTRKNNAIMTDVAEKLNDREIKALADYISGLH